MLWPNIYAEAAIRRLTIERGSCALLQHGDLTRLDGGAGGRAPLVPPAPEPAAGPFEFVLPPALEAHGPPEARGLRRDAVRLLVLNRRSGALVHTRFDRIGDYLREHDLLVLNDSRTLPALLLGVVERDAGAGEPVEARLARQISMDSWDALLLPHGGERRGQRIRFGAGLTAEVAGNRADAPWLWRLRFDAAGPALLDAIYRAGEPVRYTYVPNALPVDLYQTVYAAQPGSVEMPSAGRPFSWEVLLGLRRRGVRTAFITLHTGLSSTRNDEFDALRRGHEEWFRVSEEAAEAVNAARASGGRVIAIGTTVVRALETIVDTDGRVRASEGLTNLYVSAAHRLRAVDGLLTGLHEPRASHLDLLTAFAPVPLLQRAYQAAIDEGYLWHEFGDTNLIL